MRITIDATSALLRSAGVKGYTYHWLKHLRRQAGTDDEIRAFPMLNDWDVLDHEHSALSMPATVSRLAVLHSVNVFGSSILDRVLRDTQIFHAGNLVRRAPTRARLTATIHDLTALIMPEVHTKAIAEADDTFAERILKRADGLIAVSENTRQDAIRMLGVRPERIRTIYSGVPEDYFDATPHPRNKPYVLCVGTVEPRKNLDALLDAWGVVPPDLREHFDLLVAGLFTGVALLAAVRQPAVGVGHEQVCARIGEVGVQRVHRFIRTPRLEAKLVVQLREADVLRREIAIQQQTASIDGAVVIQRDRVA